MKVLQINSTANSGSHGRIAGEIGNLLIANGNSSYIAYGRNATANKSELIKIGGRADLASHLIISRLFDRHGFGSERASGALIREIDKIEPDLIHLHNIHGYYLHVNVLFKYLKKVNIPVVWTLHDCWPFTGHCSHFQYVNCSKWQTECFACPNGHRYPKSWFIDNSRRNYNEKKALFTGLESLVIVAPSEWLACNLKSSFLSEYETRVIYNGVDINKFKPTGSDLVSTKFLLKRKYILGVANIWSNRKGLDDFIGLRKLIDPEIDIVLVGHANEKMKTLPSGIKGIARTENIEELAALYSNAEVLVNPTYVDNFPSVNIESLACGTPVITYDTGGSPEAVDPLTGIVIEKGNVYELAGAVNEVLFSKEKFRKEQCRERAVNRFSSKERFSEYLHIYEDLSGKSAFCQV